MSDNSKLSANDLRSKSSTELNELLIDLRKEQFSLNMSKGSGQEVKVHQFTQVKKNIARVKTVMNSIK